MFIVFKENQGKLQEIEVELKAKEKLEAKSNASEKAVIENISSEGRKVKQLTKVSQYFFKCKKKYINIFLEHER